MVGSRSVRTTYKNIIIVIQYIIICTIYTTISAIAVVIVNKNNKHGLPDKLYFMNIKYSFVWLIGFVHFYNSFRESFITTMDESSAKSRGTSKRKPLFVIFCSFCNLKFIFAMCLRGKWRQVGWRSLCVACEKYFRISLNLKRIKILHRKLALK